MPRGSYQAGLTASLENVTVKRASTLSAHRRRTQLSEQQTRAAACGAMD